MKRILKVFLLLFGVMIYSQNTLSVKDGAYGYNTDFKLDIHLATDTAIKALQFDLKYDGDNFDYKSTFDLTKSRLGGEDSDHVITVKEVKSGNLRILIYSPSNKVIPNGDGELLKIKVPAGSKPGQTILLKGRGLPSQRSRSGRGSVMVLLKLDLPSKISRGLKKKLLEIRDEISNSDDELREKIREEARSRRRG